MAIDELIDVMGRASVEAVLELSATQIAGALQQGKSRAADLVWHGTQPGRVYLKERQLKVNRPRLRNKGRGANKEVSAPVLLRQFELLTPSKIVVVKRRKAS